MCRYRLTASCFISALFLALLAPLSAEVSLPSVIGDHMVVQQDMRAPIWGWAEPGEKVSVTFQGETIRDKADEDGNWAVKLKKQDAGGPFTLTVEGEENTLKIEDVLVGEVWVCSGQSNMQWPVTASRDAKKEIAAANYPELRLFQVERTVSDKPRRDCKGAWVRCSPETVPDFSAAGYFFGRELHTELGQPVGMIHTSWGGTPAESWTTKETLAADFKPIADRWEHVLKVYPRAKQKYDEALAVWQEEKKAAAKEGKKFTKQRPHGPQGPGHPWTPAGLYNAMIAPLIPYGIQGAIWYQGESNANRAYQYRELFPAMISDWRESWGQGAFPFYFVQLANFRERDETPVESEWAELREAQLMTLDLKNTGMAVAIDIGEADDIHPKNKQDAGKRLALNALAKVYDQDVEYTGPVFEKMKVEDGRVILTFSHAGDGLAAKGGELSGFAVAGEDRKFVWADGEIAGADTVVLKAEGVAEPVAVRYGWANNPECTLYNSAGLPASPFRTDDWPGLTVDKE
jgi:sialate O-acetylesterase